MPEHLFVGSRHFDGPALDHDIILSSLKHMSGDFLDLGLHFIHRFDNRRHANSP